MAPQVDIPVAANVLGTIGTVVFWCIQLVPQIFDNWRKKNTDGLPGSMLILWAICCVPFGAYAVAQNFNIPIQIQPQVCCLLSLTGWAQTLIYHNHWAVWKATSTAVIIGLFFGGIETALILTLRPLYDQGISFPIMIVGIIAAIFLAAGLLPPYYEIWKRRGRVIGINWIFLLIDGLGGFFSLMALAAQNTFDVLGGVLYIVCIILETGIVVCHLIWLFRSRKVRQSAKAQGMTFDEFVVACGEGEHGFEFKERTLRSKDEDSVDISP